MSKTTGAIVLTCLFAMLASPRAAGDSECYKGYRDTTHVEREAMLTALGVAREAMPVPPAGWILAGDDDIHVIQSLCQDYETGLQQFGHRRSYQRTDDQAARDEILQEAATAMMADMASKQGRADAIMARIQELSMQAVEAGQASNFDRIEEINREIEKASAGYQALMEEGDADDRMQAAQLEAARDLTMSVGIGFNATSEAPGYEAVPYAFAGFGGPAFRWSSARGDVREDTVLLLVGPWTPAGNGVYEIAPRADRSAFEPQSIAVRVTAYAGRIDAAVSAIDFDRLEGLLARR